MRLDEPPAVVSASDCLPMLEEADESAPDPLEESEDDGIGMGADVVGDAVGGGRGRDGGWGVRVSRSP